ncbi:DEDD exonuclease domain-containing protein [Salsipaludibacter albus]|uniref:DEDD exonuclease domain-containing protein n=1 Tax=Salsipaludibacter albus TaxID=2849650 RepID=UPI001EE40A0B|nr:DEDD exonuclease domain-containing protein [Salsipaludibacter albus]MBY5164439.1 DEDD exonuclease domain-containing protein [Salsipaludibacter albus]
MHRGPRPRPAAREPRQLTLGDSPALFDTTFAVLDLETTGLSPDRDRITEVGVVKACRGEVLGEFATLVHPGCAIPASITAVTGITDGMVAGHPPIEAVLPTLLEFLGTDTVLVAHNASFDTRFLAAALARHGYPGLGLEVVDTVAVARRVLRDEVRGLRLSRLAQHFRSPIMPDHRALTDARATLHVLHGLIERVGALGATTLADLQAYTRSTSDKAFRKVSLVADAPSEPGVYTFLGPDGEVLYVGTTGDLRTRLRRYFGGDRRRRIADLVRDTERVTWTVTSSAVEANVREVRAIARHAPRYNRRSKFPDREVHLKLTAEAFPRLSIVSSPRDDGAHYLGPVGRRARAQRLVDAIHDVSPVRQCTTRLRVAQDHATCVLKDLGRCQSPCDGTISREEYAATADEVARWLAGDPTDLLARLRARMDDLATEHRFEDAATARRRLALVATTLDRARRARALCDVPELVVGRRRGNEREVVRIVHGRLAAAARVPAHDDARSITALLRTQSAPVAPEVTDAEREEVDLLLAHVEDPAVHLVFVDGSWAHPVLGGRAVGEVLAVTRPLARRLRRDRQLLSRTKVAVRDAA